MGWQIYMIGVKMEEKKLQQYGDKKQGEAR